MEKNISKYLNKKCKISRDEDGNYFISIIDNCDGVTTIYYGYELCLELVTIFCFDEETAKQKINEWAKCDLSHYWINYYNLVTFQNMFSNCTSFNQPLDAWDISNVTSINNMFR